MSGGGGGGGGNNFFHGDNMPRSDTPVYRTVRGSTLFDVRFVELIKYSLRIKTITNNCMIRYLIHIMYMCLWVRVYSAKVEPKI